MKRFFSIALCVCIVVSVFAVSASAVGSGSVNLGDYSYDFTPRDPYYVYDDSIPTIYDDGVHVLTKVHQFNVQDLSSTDNRAPSADVIMPENWNPEADPVYSTTSVAGQFDKRIVISSGFYDLPYNITTLSNLYVSLYATFNVRCSYSVTLRFTLSDGTRKDIVYHSPVLSDTINLSFESFAEDTLLDIPFEFPANAESVRILVTATTGYATAGAFELEQFYSDFQFVWSTEKLQLLLFGESLFDSIIDKFNPDNWNGDNYNGIGGSSADVDQLESDLNEVMDNALYGDYRDTVFLFADITQQDYITNLMKNQLATSFAFIRDTVDLATLTEDVNSGYDRPNILGLLVQIALTLGVAGASLGIIVQSVSSRRFGVSRAETSSKSSSRFLALPSSRKRGGTS